MSSISVECNELQPLEGKFGGLVEESTIDESLIIPEEASRNRTQFPDLATLPIANQEGSTEQSEKGEMATLFSKYGYDEFIGPGGKRLLDRILQQVLTHANWRTWHFADEFVAPGSDCYVGPYRLASEIRPGIRKVEMDFKSLRDLGLMTVYPDYRLVKQSESGKTVMQAVIIKDFTKLYELAHEYYLWQHSPHYIPPDRQYLALILADEALTQKLLRFDNYRRIIACHKPGRKPLAAEPPMSHAAIVAIAAQDVQAANTDRDPKEFSNTDEKSVSPNRISRNHQIHLLDTSTSNSPKKEEFLPSAKAIRSEDAQPEPGQSTDEQEASSRSNALPTLQEERPAEIVKDVKAERSKMTAQEKAAAALADIIPASHWQEMNQPKQTISKAPVRPRWHTPDWLVREIARHAQELGDDPKVLGSVVTRASKVVRTLIEIYDVEVDGEGAEPILKAIRSARTRTQRRLRDINPKRRIPYMLECFINAWDLKPAELLYLESDEPLYQDGDIKDFMTRLHHSYERSGSRASFDEWTEARLDQERTHKKKRQ